MRYRRLGDSDLEVSEISLGSWLTFGGGVERDQTEACTRAAFDAGITFFDTADVYGGPQRPDMEQGYGTSEEIIGRWLAQEGRRDQIALATKLYQPMGTGPNDRRPADSRGRGHGQASRRRPGPRASTRRQR